MNVVRRLRDLSVQKREAAIVGNLVARIGALASLTLASFIVARLGGPPAVGILVLFRVLPWLVGVLLSGGLFGAAPYFLARRASDARLPVTLFTIAAVSGVMGGALWAAASPLLRETFFPNISLGVVALAGITVLTQNLESTAKACSQGTTDFVGSNRIIVLEELLFIPAYLLLLAVGVRETVAIVPAMAIGDLCTAGQGWARLARRRFFRNAGRPSLAIAGRLYSYGIRAQVGSVILLVNARLDFAIVGALVGPAALGVYAVASRYAELLRLPGLAVNYVLYPTYAGVDGKVAARDARRMLINLAWIPAAAALPLAAAAPILLPLVFGEAFRGAVVPTWILLFGLSAVGVTGIVSAFLYGAGRPGLNSLGLTSGLVVTVILDVLLIPRFEVVGAAVASCAAYLTTSLVLSLCFVKVARSYERPASSAPVPAMEPLTEVNQ
jgi:O-antigen/teichoic acid export membrane protein